MKKRLWVFVIAAMLLCLLWGGAAYSASSNQYTVTLDDNYDGGQMSGIQFVYSYILPSRSREGYTFLGWSKTRTGAPDYSANDEITEDMTLYAIWSKNGFTLTLKDNYIGGNTTIIPDVFKYTLPSRSREGVAFLGWSMTPLGKPSWTADAIISLTTDMTLYAAWPDTIFEFSFVTTDDGVCITGYTGAESSIDIPAAVDGLPVTSIGDHAFYGCSKLTQISIPPSVTSIGDHAFFGCSKLTQITIPSSVTSIRDFAFSGCSELTQISIPSSVTSIGDCAFGNAGLTSVTIAFGVTSIGDSAFYGCSELTQISIPSSVTSIGDYAFYGCSKLMKITIPSSVTSIGSEAFSHCTSLTSIMIPSSVTIISSQAFIDCLRLMTIDVDRNNSSYTSMNHALFNKTMTTIIACPGGYSGSFVIPDSVTSIWNYAFSGCTGLTGITIPSGVESIGTDAFDECTGLTDITIPSSVMSIGKGAFHSCSNLSVIYFEGTSAEWDNVSKGINWNAGCSGDLTVIFLPSVVIEKNAEGGTVTGAGWYHPDDTVTLTVSPNVGYELNHLTYTPAGGAAVEITADDNGEYNFTMPAVDVTVSATFRQIAYAVTINSGTGSGEYEEGATVTITANEPEAGKQFKEWTGADGLTFTSGSAATATATFAMPASAVTLTATYEDIRYAITDDGAAQAYIYDDSFHQVFPAEAAAGTALSLWIREDATPDADTDNYFSGEFWYRATGTDDTVFLGSVTENGWSSPVTELIMPAYDVTIGAVQAARETLTLDFTQSASASLPLDAWMQLQMFESENPLIRYDDASGSETLDINLDRADDLLITHPDETATDITLTLLPGCTAFGSFDFAFTGATDHYGVITFILPTPAFVAPDFTLPMSISTIEANAFEGIAATVVDIPEGCESIGDYAFKACPNLTQIRIPASVTSIGADIFNGCTHKVFIFGTAGSEAETYCQDHINCLFIAE